MIGRDWHLCQSRYVSDMPTRNVNLTDALDRYVADRVASGKYENASEVVRAALRELERRDAVEAAKIERLRTLIAEGEASGVDESFSFEALIAEVDQDELT
jgi:antitoxin ParD1/3/4